MRYASFKEKDDMQEMHVDSTQVIIEDNGNQSVSKKEQNRLMETKTVPSESKTISDNMLYTSSFIDLNQTTAGSNKINLHV